MYAFSTYTGLVAIWTLSLGRIDVKLVPLCTDVNLCTCVNHKQKLFPEHSLLIESFQL